MGDDTPISWTDATWTPARGCSRISEGCRNCFAERIAMRFSGRGLAFHGFANRNGWTRKVELNTDQLAAPLHWRQPRRIFCSSMTDVFHEALPDEHIALIFGVMLLAAQHTYQVLTKRAARMRQWFERWSVEACLEAAARFVAPDGSRLAPPRPWQTPARREWRDVEAWPVPWIWLGTSVENQPSAEERIPELLATQAAIRFLSCEPLIAEVDLFAFLKGTLRDRCLDKLGGSAATPGVDWAICGCESGPGARPCDVAWLRSLRDQCAAAEVPFFLKQARAVPEAIPAPDDADPSAVTTCTASGQRWIDVVCAGDGSKRKAGGVIELPYLDGVQHAAFPEVPRG